MTGRLRQGSNGAQAGSVCTVRKVNSSSDRGGHLARPRTLPMSGVRLELGFHRRSGGIPQGNRFHLPNRIVLAGEDTSGGARLTTGTRVPPGHQDHRWLGDWPHHRGRAGPFPVIQPAPLHKRPGGNRDGGSSRPPKPDPRARDHLGDLGSGLGLRPSQIRDRPNDAEGVGHEQVEVPLQVLVGTLPEHGPCRLLIAHRPGNEPDRQVRGPLPLRVAPSVLVVLVLERHRGKARFDELANEIALVEARHQLKELRSLPEVATDARAVALHLAGIKRSSPGAGVLCYAVDGLIDGQVPSWPENPKEFLKRAAPVLDVDEHRAGSRRVEHVGAEGKRQGIPSHKVKPPASRILLIRSPATIQESPQREVAGDDASFLRQSLPGSEGYQPRYGSQVEEAISGRDPCVAKDPVPDTPEACCASGDMRLAPPADVSGPWLRAGVGASP